MTTKKEPTKPETKPETKKMTEGEIHEAAVAHDRAACEKASK